MYVKAPKISFEVYIRSPFEKKRKTVEKGIRSQFTPDLGPWSTGRPCADQPRVAGWPHAAPAPRIRVVHRQFIHGPDLIRFHSFLNPGYPSNLTIHSFYTPNQLLGLIFYLFHARNTFVMQNNYVFPTKTSIHACISNGI